MDIWLEPLMVSCACASLVNIRFIKRLEEATEDKTTRRSLHVIATSPEPMKFYLSMCWIPMSAAYPALCFWKFIFDPEHVRVLEHECEWWLIIIFSDNLQILFSGCVILYQTLLYKNRQSLFPFPVNKYICSIPCMGRWWSDLPHHWLSSKPHMCYENACALE